MTRTRKILIIKTGFSEFLDRGISTTVSLGDVLICTSILHPFKNDHVTWLTSWQARQLLEGNPHINQLLIFGSKSLQQIVTDSYDVVINLEKDIGVSTLVGQIDAQRKFGFFFNDNTFNIDTYQESTEYLLAGQENHMDIDQSIYELLYEIIDEQWEEGFGPLIGYESPSSEQFDIGFNYEVGKKWPTKAWPRTHWKELEKLLQNEFIVSWQKGHGDLFEYIDWIKSCRVIVTSDSLGQAIGQALHKKVIALYGPTNYRRIQAVKGMTVVASTISCPHMPCYLPHCKHNEFCMDFIRPEKVADLCRNLLTDRAVVEV